ncbi:MAG: sterol desaturase family protein, partial [Noviherbaspirillum sp.]
MLHTLIDWFSEAHAWLFQSAVQPLLFMLELGDIAEEAFDGTEWFLIGLLELALLYLVLRPLEAWIPVKPDLNPAARRIDFLYTCLHRLGGFALFAFFALDPLFDALASELHLADISPFNLERL